MQFSVLYTAEVFYIQVSIQDQPTPMKQAGLGPFRKYVAEFIGTFFLVLLICTGVSMGQQSMVGLFACFLLIGISYAFGHVSGSHFNPAITVAAYLRGIIQSSEVIPFIVAQSLGGILAALLAGFLVSTKTDIPHETTELSIGVILIGEILGSLLVVYTYLNLFFNRKTSGNTYFGLAMGMVYGACYYIFSLVSLSVFNPSVALGLSMMEAVSWSVIWAFGVGSLVGGVLAAFLTQYMIGREP